MPQDVAVALAFNKDDLERPAQFALAPEPVEQRPIARPPPESVGRLRPFKGSAIADGAQIAFCIKVRNFDGGVSISRRVFEPKSVEEFDRQVSKPRIICDGAAAVAVSNGRQWLGVCTRSCLRYAQSGSTLLSVR